jgi:hypothetical protein
MGHRHLPGYIMRYLRIRRTVSHLVSIELTTRYIDSPALGSAGPLMKRVCYGIVIPGLIIGAVLYIHIPAKYGKSRDETNADYQSLSELYATHVT